MRSMKLILTEMVIFPKKNLHILSINLCLKIPMNELTTFLENSILAKQIQSSFQNLCWQFTILISI